MINLERLAEYPVVAIDVETTGLHFYRDTMFGVAVAARDGDRIVSKYWDIRNTPRVVKILADVVPRCKKVVNANIKFDAHFLHNIGINLPLDRIECTGVLAALINEHEPSFSLDSLSRKYVGRGKVEIYEELARLFGGQPTRTAQITNLHRAPASLVAKYAVEDAALAIELWEWQQGEVARQGLEQVWNLERRLTPVLIDMEEHGVRVDEERAHNSLGKIDTEVSANQRRLNDLIGGSLNVNSSPQMRKAFGVKKVEAPTPKGYVWTTDRDFHLPFTDSGEASIGKDSLISMSTMGDDRAKLVLTIRKLVKAKSFLKDHIIGHAVNGRVFPNYNQTRGDNELGTGTGRFSIDDPALQQIPMRDLEIAEIARSCFIPEDGCDWICGDWKQMEFRVFAHYTKDENIIKAYNDDPNTDYHQVVADLTGLPRTARFTGDANAKQINLGLVFGMGKGKMAWEMGMEYTIRYGKDGQEWYNAGPKAIELFDKYHAAIPGVQKLLDQAGSIAKSRGYVETIMKRHIRFPGGKATHKAGGLVFQGSSADAMKQKMVELHPICKKEGVNMLLSVHDELNFSAEKGESARQSVAIKEVLECFDGVKCPIKFRVPIRSSVAIGPNWFEACK